MHRDGQLLGAPGAVGVGGAHPEARSRPASRLVYVARCSAPASIQRRIEAIQAIGVAVVGGRGEIERRELEAHQLVVIGQRQRPIRPRQLLLRQRPVEARRGGQHHARRRRAELGRGGREGVEAVVAAEEQRAVTVLVVGVEVELLALQAVPLVKHLDRMRARLEPHQAVGGAQPQSVRRRRTRCRTPRGSAAGWRSSRNAPPARRRGAADDVVEAAAGGADPHLAAPIDVQREHGIVGETGRVAIVAPIVVEAAARAIEQIESAADGADPQIAERILGDGAGARITQRVWASSAPIRIAGQRGRWRARCWRGRRRRCRPRRCRADPGTATSRRRPAACCGSAAAARHTLYLPARQIDAVESAGHGADPQAPAMVVEQRHDVIVAQAQAPVGVCCRSGAPGRCARRFR